MLLLAVAILNGVDLIYTLFASRIGMLHELNPIAATFLQTGLTPSLVCYKLLMLLCGVGLIWKLRDSRLALPACWVLVGVYIALGILWYAWVCTVSATLEQIIVASP